MTQQVQQVLETDVKWDKCLCPIGTETNGRRGGIMLMPAWSLQAGRRFEEEKENFQLSLFSFVSQ